MGDGYGDEDGRIARLLADVLDAALAIRKLASRPGAKQSAYECMGLAGHVGEIVAWAEEKRGWRAPADVVESLRRLWRLYAGLGMLIKTLADGTMLKRVLWKETVSRRIAAASGALGEFSVTFDLASQQDLQRVDAETKRAREMDTQMFEAMLRSVLENDNEILRTLGVEPVMFHSATLSIEKRLSQLANEDSVERRLLSRALEHIYRAQSRTPSRTPPDGFFLSALDVIVDSTAKLGPHLFGGSFYDAAVCVRALPRGIPRPVIEECVGQWRSLEHDNVVSYMGACLSDDTPCVVYERSPTWNASRYLEQHPEADRVKLLHDMSLGLVCLHSKDVVHGDLRADNVIVSADQKAALVGYGLKQLDAPTEGVQSVPDKYSDVYDFGLTIVEVFKGSRPSKGTEPAALIRNIGERDPTVAVSGVEDALCALVADCCAPDPVHRPLAANVAARLGWMCLMRKGSSRSEEEGEKEKEAQAGSLSGSMSAGSRTSLSSSSSSSVLLAYATSSSSDDGEPVPPPPPEVRVAPQQMLPEPQPQPQPDQQQRPDQQLRQPGRASQVSALSDFTEVMTLSRALPTAPHYYYYPPQLPPPPVRPAMSSARSIAPSVATSRSGSHAAGRGKTPRAKTYESTAPLAIALMDSLSPAPPPRTRQRKDSAPARVNAQEARAAPPLQIQILQQHYAWADPGSVPGSASTVRAPMSTVRQTLDPEPGPKRPSLPATPSRVVWKVASSSSETSSSPLEESPPPQSGLVNAESEAYVPPPPPPPPSRPARPERRYTTGRDREEDEMRAWAKAALVKRHYRTLREPDPLPPGGWGSVPRFGEGVLVFTQNR